MSLATSTAGVTNGTRARLNLTVAVVLAVAALVAPFMVYPVSRS